MLKYTKRRFLHAIRVVGISIILAFTPLMAPQSVLPRVVCSRTKLQGLKTNWQPANHSMLEWGEGSTLLFLVRRELQVPLDQQPMECEGAATRLDFAVIDTKKLQDAYLIIVARLGTGKRPYLSDIRLSVVREYILRMGPDLKYVMAKGSRVKGLGRIELYVGCRLTEVMPFGHNAKNFCTSADGG
jgi:hypothetical protein